MPNYVILDTSIYREMGLKFYNNIDYQNLCRFTSAIGSEVLQSGIVIEEFSFYYKTIVEKKLADYVHATNSLRRDPYLDIKQPFQEINGNIDRAVKAFINRLKTDPNTDDMPLASIMHTSIDAIRLTKFILESRNQDDNKLQVRDFLIWESLLAAALGESVDLETRFKRRKIKFGKGTISFITKDSGFTNNPLFKQRQNEYGVTNLVIYNSIPQFLHTKGFNLNFVSSSLLLSKITDARLLKDLHRDIHSLITYVSPRYNSTEGLTKPVELAEIVEREILEFYSYYEDEGNVAKYVVHLKVIVNVVFAADANYSERSSSRTVGYLESYDNRGRPLYNAPVIFFYRGLLNVDRKSIKSVQFIDFLPEP